MKSSFHGFRLKLVPLLVSGGEGRSVRVEVEEINKFISGAESPLGDEEGNDRLRRKRA